MRLHIAARSKKHFQRDLTSFADIEPQSQGTIGGGQFLVPTQIALAPIALVPIGAAPWLFGFAHTIYGVTALLAGVLMVAFAWRVRCEREGERAERAAYDLFAFSILYLFVLFAVLLVEGSVIGRAM